jgi:hypothetical protein
MTILDTGDGACWGLRGPYDFNVGPFASEEEARAYMHSKQFVYNFDRDPADTWVESFTGSGPVHVRCEDGLEWTRQALPRFRNPGTGKFPD